MKNPYTIIIRPRITEKTVALSYGDPRIKNEEDLVLKYTFEVDVDANKIEIKQALERFYDVNVEQVRILRVRPKTRKTQDGKEMEKRHAFKKALVTLSKKSKALDLASFEVLT